MPKKKMKCLVPKSSNHVSTMVSSPLNENDVIAPVKKRKKAKTEVEKLYDNLEFIFFEENITNERMKDSMVFNRQFNKSVEKSTLNHQTYSSSQTEIRQPSKSKLIHENMNLDTRKMKIKDTSEKFIDFEIPNNTDMVDVESVLTEDSNGTEPYVGESCQIEDTLVQLLFHDHYKPDPVVIGDEIGIGSLVIVRLQLFGWWFGKVLRIKTFRYSKPYLVEVKWFGDHTVMEVPVYCIENYKVFAEVFSEKKMRKKYYKKAVEEFLMELFNAFGGKDSDLQQCAMQKGTSLFNVLVEWGRFCLDDMEDVINKTDQTMNAKVLEHENPEETDGLTSSDCEPNDSLSSDNDQINNSSLSTSSNEIILTTPTTKRDINVITQFPEDHIRRQTFIKASNKFSPKSQKFTRKYIKANKLVTKLRYTEDDLIVSSKRQSLKDTSINQDVRNIQKALKELKDQEKSDDSPVDINNNVRDNLPENLPFKVGDLVIGKLRGFDWWFGKIISHQKARKSQPTDGSFWIKWYGDQKISMLPIERLENLSNFPTRVITRKLKGVYLKAVKELLEDAAKCCDKEFPDEPDKRYELMISWAMSSFEPGGVERFCVEESAVTPEESDDDSEEDDRVEKQFAPDLSMEVKALFDEVLLGKRNVENLCLGCGDRKVNCKHPLFYGGLCKECKEAFMESVYLFDEEGFQMYCCICGDGQHIISCDTPTCKRSYCSVCLEMFCGNGYMNELASMDSWECFLCSQTSVNILKCREDWQEHVNQLFKEDLESVDYGEVIFYNPIAVEKRKPLRVLALFDGIATGLYVLKELDFKIDLYIAAEIDENAITVSKVRHGSTVKHIGDVRSLQQKDIENLGPFDLVLGGSPCNDLSIANPARKGIYEGTGVLFFEYFRLLNYVKPNPPESRPFFWLFENVVGMRYKDRETISRFLQCHPVVISAKDVSAQYRARYFWGNLPGMGRSLTPLPNDKLLLQDCLEEGCGRQAKFDKVRCITTKSNSIRQTRHLVLPVVMEKKNDNLWITEIERLFGFPKHYTDVANMGRTHRQKLLGKAWSVPVIRHLLTPLKDYFQLNDSGDVVVE